MSGRTIQFPGPINQVGVEDLKKTGARLRNGLGEFSREFSKEFAKDLEEAKDFIAELRSTAKELNVVAEELEKEMS